jgi:hypothetical protein
MRHLMNLETVYTYEGTHDIHIGAGPVPHWDLRLPAAFGGVFSNQ